MWFRRKINSVILHKNRKRKDKAERKSSQVESTSTKKKNSSVDLLHGGEAGALLRFSVPIIFSYLLQQIYTISDAAICGQTLTADEVAGVNDVFPLIFIFLQFAFGCTAGFSVVTSIKAGCGDKAGVRKSFAAQIILGAGGHGRPYRDRDFVAVPAARGYRGHAGQSGGLAGGARLLPCHFHRHLRAALL